MESWDFSARSSLLGSVPFLSLRGSNAVVTLEDALIMENKRIKCSLHQIYLAGLQWVFFPQMTDCSGSYPPSFYLLISQQTLSSSQATFFSSSPCRDSGREQLQFCQLLGHAQQGEEVSEGDPLKSYLQHFI